jgi:nucleotide-binding universal stress UspA family protein
MEGHLMKVLIGVDGSTGSDIAISELKRAGLPQRADAVVLSAADVILPASADAVAQVSSDWLAKEIEKARARAMDAVEQARAIAARASKTIEAAFPDWIVHSEGCADSPAWGLVKKAEEWEADLLVVGSHNRSALGRLMLGSVAQRVLHYAPTSVRISRRGARAEDSPVALIAGVDGSRDAEAAVSAVAARTWPPGSTVLLVTAIDPVMATGAVNAQASAHTAESIQGINEASVRRLSDAGLAVTPLVKEGDPRRILVQEAKRLEADCIFLGARGLRGVERLLLGSVSAAVAARARCSVEVVRPARPS